MQIKTKETVQKTLAKYRWDDLENWEPKGNVKDRTFQRLVYQKDNVAIMQRKWANGYGISLETPEYTLYISSGQHPDFFAKKKLTPYYAISIATTHAERKVYQDMMDEKGFKDIRGNRDLLFHFMENVPDRFWEIAIDEKANHISTYWMRIPSEIGAKKLKRRLTKERE